MPWTLSRNATPVNNCERYDPPFEPIKIAGLQLANPIVTAPMTKSFAGPDGVPNDKMLRPAHGEPTRRWIDPYPGRCYKHGRLPWPQE